MSKFIICNGGYRTGSTRLYNIVRHLYEIKNVDYIAHGGDERMLNLFKNKPVAPVYVIKAHYLCPDPYPELRMINIRRDYRGVAASIFLLMQNTYGTESIDRPTADDIFVKLDAQQKITAQCDERTDAIVVRYRTLMEKPLNLIKRVGNFLNIETTNYQRQIINIRSNIYTNKSIVENLKTEADGRTELRQNHISKYEGDPDAWQKVLPPEFAQEIMERYPQ